MPEQFEPERIRKPDVQSLLSKISIKPSDEFSRRFPQQMPCYIAIELKDGAELTKEKRDYEGFHTRPMTWDTVVGKFGCLTDSLTPGWRDEIMAAIEKLETIQIRELMKLLGQAA